MSKCKVVIELEDLDEESYQFKARLFKRVEGEEYEPLNPYLSILEESPALADGVKVVSFLHKLCRKNPK